MDSAVRLNEALNRRENHAHLKSLREPLDGAIATIMALTQQTGNSEWIGFAKNMRNELALINIWVEKPQEHASSLVSWSQSLNNVLATAQ